MPVYNDWSACEAVIAGIDNVFAELGSPVEIIAIDDGSTVAGEIEARPQWQAIKCVSILRLRRNLGHQRALCIGLAYVEANLDSQIIVVMDSDGEDLPTDIPKLLARFQLESGRKIVFAERTKRSESRLFRMGYVCYRGIHRLLTGHRVRVGNFSVIPRSSLRSLVVVPELWSHYAAAVFNSRLPYCSVPTCRGRRLAGESKMDVVALITHGLAAISVFSGRVGVRLLLACCAMALSFVLGISLVIAVRLFTPFAIPGWATFTVGILLLLLLQSLLAAAVFCFVILSGQSRASFLPARDYSNFVERLDKFPLKSNQGPAS